MARRTSSTTPELLARRRPPQRRRPLPLLALEAIVADLDTRRHAFHVAIENWQHDFNIGIGRPHRQRLPGRRGAHRRQPRWNRRGAMVTDRYQHVRHHADGRRPGGLGAARGRRRRCSASTTCPGSVAAGDAASCRAGACLAVRPGGPGAVRRGARGLRRRRSRSPSSARPARSTPAPPRRSRCTPGSASTPTSPAPADDGWIGGAAHGRSGHGGGDVARPAIHGGDDPDL